MSTVLKVKLENVDCNLSRTAIKTTHTTDVLIDARRKAYLDPWNLIYPGGCDTLPDVLKNYSLSALPGLTGLKWATKGQTSDKKISVVLKTKHLIRLTFNTFRRSFHGADPVAASRAIETAASKPRGKAEKSQTRRRVEKLVKPKPMTFNHALRLANSGNEAAVRNFDFGAAPPTWSWNR